MELLSILYNDLYFKLLPVQASNASSLKKVENDDLYTQVQSPRVIQLLIIIRGSNFKFRKSSGNRMKFISKSFFLVYRDDGCPADHQQKGELYTLDCGDYKSTQMLQPHFINRKVFWRLVCTQNYSNLCVYSYDNLTYCN